MEKGTLLFFLPFMPYPLESGGHQALYNGIRVVKDDYNVLVTYSAIDNEEYRQNEAAFLKALPGITVLPMLSYEAHLSRCQRIYQSVKAFVKNLLGIKQVPYIPNVYDSWIPGVSPLSACWGEHLDHVFSEHKIDIVQVEMPWMIGAIYNIPKNIKKVFVHHEIAFVKHQLEIGDAPSSTAVAYADFTKMVEINLLNQYDAVITLSKTDKEKLVEAGVVKPIEASFAVVDPCNDVKSVPYTKTLSFIGFGDHLPNEHGLRWFLNNCWPEIMKRDRQYRLIVIGKWEQSVIEELTLQFENLEFKGYVEDLDSALQGTLMIVPILIGSGIRMKILEAASRGIPFISTSVGAEGLPVTDGYDCFIRDIPEEFVNAVFEMEDGRIRESLVNNARKMVMSQYSVDALKTNRVGILSRVLGMETQGPDTPIIVNK